MITESITKFRLYAPYDHLMYHSYTVNYSVLPMIRENKTLILLVVSGRKHRERY